MPRIIESEHLPPAQFEAKALLALVRNGESVEQIRNLIRVSDREERLLREFAAKDLLSGRLFVKVIAFRRRVLEEFDRLAARRWLRQKRGSPGIRNELKPHAQIS